MSAYGCRRGQLTQDGRPVTLDDAGALAEVLYDEIDAAERAGDHERFKVRYTELLRLRFAVRMALESVR